MSKKYSKEYLKRLYQISERKLERACDSGNLKAVKLAMKEHHRYEYALLHQRYDKAKKSVN